MSDTEQREARQALLTTRGALRQAQKQIDAALAVLDAVLPPLSQDCNKVDTKPPHPGAMESVENYGRKV